MRQLQDMQMNEDNAMHMRPTNFIQEILRHDASGTSVQPDSSPVPMLIAKFRVNIFGVAMFLRLPPSSGEAR